MKTVEVGTDIRFYRIFYNSLLEEGDSQFLFANNKLVEINEKCKEAKLDRIFGDCNEDKSLSNRLLKDL